MNWELKEVLYSNTRSQKIKQMNTQSTIPNTKGAYFNKNHKQARDTFYDIRVK